MTGYIAEFTIEPFVDGNPGRHVRAALEAIVAGGLEYQLGPFATTVEGDRDLVLAAMHDAVAAALDAGATRVSITFVAGADDA